MVCTKCGAGLMDSDQFCPKCGTRVIKEMRCPDCGAVLREGTKFCHKCGRMMEASGGGSRAEDMADIPMDAIERNILSETEAELKADRRRERTSGGEGLGRGTSARGREGSDNPGRGNGSRSMSGSENSSRGSGSRSMSGSEGSSRGTSRRSASVNEEGGRGSGSRSASGGEGSGRGSGSRNGSGGGTAHGSAVRNTSGRRKESEPEVRRKSSVPAPPSRGKRASYREDDWDDDWDDDDEDWEDDDWDDDEDEGVDFITVMTAALGCVILVVVALVGFNLYKQYAPKNYDKAGAERLEEGQSDEGNDDGQDGQDSQAGQEVEDSESDGIGAEEEQNTYKLKIVSNVNVRDQPSTSGTNVLKVAKAGETYTCMGSAGDGNWYEIVLEDGSAGYVFTDYVEVEE